MVLDNFRTIELIWDKANKSIIKTIKTASSDTTGRYLSVKILDGGQEATLSNAKLQLYWEHPNFNTSGTDDFNTVNNGGLFMLTFSDEMLTNIGELNAYLVLTLPDGKITSDDFPIKVFKGANKGVVVASNGDNIAIKALKDATDKLILIEAGADVAVLEDDSITSSKIADEAIAVSHLEYELRKKLNIFPNEIISGSFISSSNHSSGAGKAVYTAVYMRTEPALLKAGDTIITNALASPNALVVATYNLDGTFKGEGVIGSYTIGSVNTPTKYTASVDEYVVISNSTSYVPLSNFYVEFWTGETVEDNDFTEETLMAPQAIRKPVISFVFDDGNTTDANVVSAFKERNFTCGFALPTTVSTTRDELYLDYQKDGFEILSHSTDATAMNTDATSQTIIETKMKNSKQVLENRGFKITGWVTPSSTLHESYLPIVEKYYEYAYTKYLGLWTTSTEEAPYNSFVEDTRQLKRVSAESSSQQNLIGAIDKTIADGGMLTIYAHIYPNALTAATLTTVLDYLETKVENGECLVLTPSNAYKHFFTMRHSDYLNSLNG